MHLQLLLLQINLDFLQVLNQLSYCLLHFRDWKIFKVLERIKVLVQLWSPNLASLAENLL